MSDPVVLSGPTPDNLNQAFTKVNANFAGVDAALAAALGINALEPDAMVGWSLAPSGGTAEEPALLTYALGTKRAKIELTWSSGKVTVAVYSRSTDSGATWSAIGTQTITYDANDNVTGVAWT